VCRQPGHNRRVCPNQPIEHGRAQRARDRLVEGKYTPYYTRNCTNHSTDSEACRSNEDNVTHVSDCDRLSNQYKARSFNSSSSAFTDSHTDSEPEELDTSWLFSTIEDWAEDNVSRGVTRVVAERGGFSGSTLLNLELLNNGSS
jgi:hypothetical protein